MPDFRTGSPWWLRTGLAAVLLAAGILMIAIPVDQQKNGWARGLFGGNWWNVPIYNVTGLFGFHGYDAYRYAKEHWFGGGLSDAEIAEAKAWLDHQQSVQQQAEKEPLFGKYKGKNVLIVQAEAFQTFVLNRSINGQEITPNLNKLIGQSLYFPNFYHQTGQGRTSDADFLTNCSLHPMPSGSVFVRFADHSFDCLPQMLKADGYDSTVHHAYDGSFWNRNNMYHNMQYDKFYNIKDFTIDEPLGWSLGDKSFFRQTVQQLKDRGKEPFYAMTITLSSHHPYHIPSAFELDVGEFSGSVFGDYLQAAHYVDEAVGVLVDELKKAGLWDDTILMFYGDHDNSITDWSVYEKFYGHAMSPLEKELQLKKVPFFIHFPNDENAGVNEKAAGQLDIAPTVLDLLGISTKPYHLMGLSLMTDTPKPVVFRSGSYTDGNVYFVSAGDGTPEHGTCYSMKTGAQTDIAACSAGARAAHDELVMSDRIVEYDLLPVFRQEEAAAAGAK
jgi:phosphoglycerol transferase MdoB-like AlkP superfamily enzyme